MAAYNAWGLYSWSNYKIHGGFELRIHSTSCNVYFITIHNIHNNYSIVDQSRQKINDDLTVFLKPQLGKGAFGAVFKGNYKGKECAVKILVFDALEMKTDFPLGDEEASKTSIDSESILLESLQHTNVVQFLSTAKHPKSGGTILVVELMDCSLRSYLLDEEPLTSECEISLSKDMACGLAYIHSKDIIHRDLCGDNVLLKLTQPVPVAKISDFGLSRFYDPSKYTQTFVTVWGIYHSRPFDRKGRNTIIAWMCFPLGRLWCR